MSSTETSAAVPAAAASAPATSAPTQADTTVATVAAETSLPRTARAAARRAATAAAAMARAETSAKDDEEEPEEEEDDAQSEEEASDSEFHLSEAGGAHTEATEDSDSGTGDDEQHASPRRLPRGAPGQLSRFASTGQTTHDQFARPTTPRRLTRGASDGASAAAGSAAVAASSLGAAASAVRNSAGMLVCDHPNCGRSFRKVGKLNRHKLSHAPGKAFVCTYPGCSKSFTRNDRLRRHWKIHQAQALEMGGSGVVDALNRAAGAVENAVFTFAPDSAEAEAELMRRLEEERMDLVSGSDIEPFVPDAILRRASPPATGDAAAAAASSSSAPVLVTSAAVIAPVLPPLVKFFCTYPACSFSFLLREHLKRHQSTHGPTYATSRDAAAALAAPASAEAPPPPLSPAAAAAAAASESGNVSSSSSGGVVLAAASADAGIGRGRPKSSYPCVHAGCYLTFDKAHKLREHAYVHSGVLPWICNAVLTKEEMLSDSDADGDDEEEEGAVKAEEKGGASAAIEEGAAAAASSSSASAAAAAVPSPSAAASVLHYCKEGFMSRAQLTKHQHLCHDPKRHLCGEAGCGAMFVRFQDLRKHRSTAHPAAHVLRCEKCAGSFKRVHDLEEHRLTHMSAEERAAFLVPCPFTMAPHNCSKRFTTKSNLNQHVRRVHDALWKGKMREGVAEAAAPVVLRFPCPFADCTARSKDKPYRVKQTLQRHLVSWHQLPRDKIHDAEFIQRMVDAVAAAAAAGQPLPTPAHPNSAKAASTRTRLTGAAVPLKKNLEPGTHKRKRSAGAATAAAAAATTAKEEPAEADASPAPVAAKDESKDNAADASMIDAPERAAAPSDAVQSASSENKDAEDAAENKRPRLDL